MPCAPVFGAIDVSVGTAGAVTVRVRPVAAEPPGAVTFTVCAPSVAVGEIAQLAVTDVAVDAVGVHATPLAVTVTAVVPARFVPVSV